MHLQVNCKQIEKGLMTLNTFNSDKVPGHGTTRITFSREDLKARSYIKELMVQAGLLISQDAIGNIYGTLKGTDSSLSPVWSGSHIDTVIRGGMYDGTVGVIGAIEALRAIREAGLKHKRDLVAVVFTGEEPVRFGIGCIGSRCLAGCLTEEKAKQIRDDKELSLWDTIKKLSFDLEHFSSMSRQKGEIHSFFELHIEQAGLLEQSDIPIGIVTGICAPSYIKMVFTGIQEHAGSTPMDIRKDALCAASEVILELERLAATYNKAGDSTTVGTVGKLSVIPNAPNVIPGKVEFLIDIRDVDGSVKNQYTNAIINYGGEIAKRRKLKLKYKLLENDQPCKSDLKLTSIIEDACRSLKLPYRFMTSGAYHDALMISHIAPVAMIFIPSKNGISHDPSEYTSFEDIVNGANVLTNTLYIAASR